MLKLSLRQIKQVLQGLHEQAPTETIEDYANRVWLSLPRIAYGDLPKSLQQTVREVYTTEKLLPFLLEMNNVESAEELAQITGLGANLDKAIGKAVRSAKYTIEQWDIQAPEYRINSTDSHPLLAKDGAPFPVLYAVQFLDAFHEVTSDTQPKGKQQPPAQQDIKELSRLPVVKMPTSPLTFLFARVLNAGPAGPKPSKVNRHERIEILFNSDQNATQYTRKNKGQEYTVTVYDPENTLKGGGKALGKLFFYMLQCWEAAGYGREFTFPLQSLVDLGMYQSIDAARRAVKTFMGRQALIQLSQMITTGRGKERKKTNTGGVVFYNYSTANNDVTISVNDKMPMTLLANFFTMFPMFAYGLSTNAFWIVHYIMYLARQNGASLEANKGRFTISLESVRQYLELPAPDEVKNYKYNEKIREPIEAAIEEIEEAMRTGKHDFMFTITPHCADDSSINAWLAGELEIQLPPEQAARYVEIYQKEEAAYQQRERERRKAEEAARAKAAKKGEAGK